jgi:hypothetical protein
VSVPSRSNLDAIRSVLETCGIEFNGESSGELPASLPAVLPATDPAVQALPCSSVRLPAP